MNITLRIKTPFLRLMLAFALIATFSLVTPLRVFANSLPNSTTGQTELAPWLTPVMGLEINPIHLVRDFGFRNGFQISTLMSYIERLYPGKQFHSNSSDFQLNKTQFGIAITDIQLPDHVNAYISIGGDQFLYPVASNPNSGLARLLEPHQTISFRNTSSDLTKQDFQVRLKFRLWDLRERKQISPFNWYRLDEVGGYSPFSYEQQEIVFTVTQNPPEPSRPFWTNENRILNTYEIDFNQTSEFVISVKDMVSNPRGEADLRHTDNGPLGVRISGWNSPLGRFFYRYHAFTDWVEIQGGLTYMYLGLEAEIKIEIDENELDNHNIINFQGWDGINQNINTSQSLTIETKQIRFVRKHY